MISLHAAGGADARPWDFLGRSIGEAFPSPNYRGEPPLAFGGGGLSRNSEPPAKQSGVGCECDIFR